MQIGIIGLGRMGANIGRRLMGKGHKVVAYDREPKAVAALPDGRSAQARAAPRTCPVSQTRPSALPVGA